MRERIAQGLSNLLGDDQRRGHSGAARMEARIASAIEPDEEIQVPAGVSGHDTAVFLLHVAAEIEHALMVQYLYAAYSLGGPQVPESRWGTVRAWQDIVLSIAKEEMAHFITVQNILRLIGGPLNLEREDYPWDAPYVPITFALEPLSRESLARYVFVESPDDWPKDAEPLKDEIVKLASKGQTRKPRQLRELYTRMIEVLNDSALMPEHMFQADTLGYQASADEWGRGYNTSASGVPNSNPAKPDLVIHTAYSRSTASDALTAIAEQGEAPDIDQRLNEQSHFRRFFDLFRAFPDRSAGWSPIQHLAKNPTTIRNVSGTTYIADPVSRRWAELLNLRYRMLLTSLGHTFRLSGGTGIEQDAKARGMVLHQTFAEMYNLRAISRTLVQLPCGGANQELRAGPSFEMPYSLTLPMADYDVWRLHLDLLQAAVPLICSLLPDAGPDGKRYLRDLAALDRRQAAAIERIIGTGAVRSGARRLIGSFS
jgi:hypothetical protein